MPSIALVDDDRNILASVTMLLEQEGYQVRSYTDGASALTGLSATPPDLAILDIKMPRLNGMELLQRLRQAPATANMPVIFLTSKDEEVDEIMGLRMGADDYVTKNMSLPHLLARVSALFRRADAQREPPPGEDLLTRGPLTLDVQRFTVTWNGKKVWTGETTGMVTGKASSINGKEYVVIVCGGGKNGAPSGSSIVAFALPR